MCSLAVLPLNTSSDNVDKLFFFLMFPDLSSQLGEYNVITTVRYDGQSYQNNPHSFEYEHLIIMPGMDTGSLRLVHIKLSHSSLTETET